LNSIDLCGVVRQELLEYDDFDLYLFIGATVKGFYLPNIDLLF